MSSHTCTERNRLDLLQTEYRRSWHNFTVAVEDLQNTLTNTEASSEVVAKARIGVEDAVREYRNARNTLADCLLETEASGNEAASTATTARDADAGNTTIDDHYTPTRILANSRAA